MPHSALEGQLFFALFYNANFFLSLITVLSPTFCSFEILLRDFSIYLNSKMTLLYFTR